MVKPDYDNFLVHELFESTPVPAREDCIPSQKVAKNHDKPDDREERGLFPPQARRDATV